MPRQALPNAPLGEVVFEIRFPGDLRLYQLWGDLQHELKADFPHLLVPKVVDGEAPTLKPFHLTSDNQSERICLALNLFSFISRSYLDFPAFRARYEQYLNKFFARVRPNHLTRLGLRYINWLPKEFPGSERDHHPLHPCLNLQLIGLPTSMNVSQPLFVTRLSGKGHNLLIQLGEDAKGGVRLDFDCSVEGTLDTGSVLGHLDALHETIDEVFFSLVTSSYLAYMKGDAK